jgi:excisionase family DNA binding protein
MAYFSDQIMNEIRVLVQEEISISKSLEEHSIPKSPNPLTLKEAAEFLKVAPVTLYRYVQNGELPYSKISKQLYFFEEDIISYLKENKVKSKAEIAQKVEERFSTSKSWRI